MTKRTKLINHIKDYLGSGMWKYEACYIDKNDLEVILMALEQIPTKEEQALLKKWRDNRGVSMEEFEQAMDELQGPSDAISRQAVFDLMRSLKRWCVRSEDGKFNNVGLLYDDVMFGVDKLSSVNPQEPKTGHWIDYNWSDTNGTCRWGIKCSQCNKEYKYGAEVWLSPNYCPNCGIKMKEGV